MKTCIPFESFKHSFRKTFIAASIFTFVFKNVYSEQCTNLQFNKKYVGQRLVGFGISTSTEDSIGTCVKKCFQLTHCLSTNFDTVSKQCVLNNVTADEMESAVVKSDTSILSDLSAWPKAMVGTCGDKPCHGTEICMPAEKSYFCRNSVQCPDGWIQYNDACYLIEDRNIMNFSKAVNYCEGLGADIVQIETADENQFVKNNLQLIPVKLIPGYWLGLTDEVDGEWRWYKTGELATFFDWRSGQPNGAIIEVCAVHWVHVSPPLEVQMYDISCSEELHPICELQLSV